MVGEKSGTDVKPVLYSPLFYRVMYYVHFLMFETIHRHQLL